MNSKQIFTFAATFMAIMSLTEVASAGVQVGTSGTSYASDTVQCALHPVDGMSPVVKAGLYNPSNRTSGIVSLNGANVASLTANYPETNVWLANGANSVVVATGKKTADTYAFDALLSYPGQPNMCIPDTSANMTGGDLEYAASNKSYATVTPGCAWSAATGRTQPYIHLFDNGTYVLNVTINNVPLTQLSSGHTHTPVFLSAGLNVISIISGTTTDYYVRNGGTGTCTLP